MTALLMTGFPGFLGSALLPRLLARREGVRAICVVQPRHMATARQRLRDIQAAHPDTVDRVDLVEGDITEPDLGVDRAHAQALDDVTEVWHLAAIYDLAVPLEIARKVNVDGTARVIEFCQERTDFSRLQYVSTCYVSGQFVGEFTEEMLEEGQSFYNHYESTKFEAEVLVRKAMVDGLPATIYRPGIVVGDSHTGETQKFDGPYFVAAFLRKQPSTAVLPAVDKSVKASLVPRDFVIAAMDELSVHPESAGKTYALTDPNPPTAYEVGSVLAGKLGKRLIWAPVPLGPLRAVVGAVPGLEGLLGLPAEALDYFASKTTYSATNTVADLEGTGVECPRFADYAGTLIDYMIAHPEVGSKAMV